jgi:ELWxxDGT repeat protein
MALLRGLAPLFATALLGSALQAQPAFLVKDIAPGAGTPYWPYETEAVTLGDLAVFAAYDSVHGIEIWKSDGTAAGTQPFADVCPGICSSGPWGQTVVGSTVFFGADHGIHGRSLWKTDGTAEGTTLIREISPSAPVALGSLLVFNATTPEGGQEIWRSDGTRAGTVRISEQRPGTDSSNTWTM